MKFYLGTHRPAWVNKYHEPFFISCRCILNRKSELVGDWIIDSAGFTELMKYGKYIITPEEYIECIEITNPWFGFCQDWMCEEVIINKTGKSVEEHQELTCLSYIKLKKMSSKIQPVIQGFDTIDYLNHIKMYERFGVNINQLFGVGSICKRNSSPDIIYEILSSIKDFRSEILLHGFGLKITSLVERRIYSLLYSSDSMAWSFAGRYNKIMCPGCSTKNCNNCYRFAMIWYNDLLSKLNTK